MNIVVLGGSGFIGTRLVAALIAAGHAVRIFDKAASAAYPNLVTRGDIRDMDAVARVLVDCDCAINLAAEHSDDVRPVSLYYDVNVGGARHLVRAAEINRVMRIIFVSSVSVYGLQQPMADEASPLRPENDYGRSKAEAEGVYRGWLEQDPTQRSLTTVRPSVVFGEGNRGNVYHLIDHIRRGRFVMVGNGRNQKSIAYVGNLVDFLIAQLDNPSGHHLYNYADKPDLSTEVMVQQIRALLPAAPSRKLRIPYSIALTAAYLLDAIGFLRRRSFSISSVRIKKFCADTRIAADAAQRSGFSARVSLAAALQRTIDQLPR